MPTSTKYETPDTGDKEGERYESCKSSVDDVQTSLELLDNDTGDKEGEKARETTFSLTLDKEKTPNTVNNQQLKCKNKRNENLIHSEYGQVPSEHAQNQVTTTRVVFRDLPSGVEADKVPRQYRDSEIKRDSCDADTTKVLNSIPLTECSQCNQATIMEDEDEDEYGLGNENLMKPSDLEIVIDSDLTHPKTLEPPIVIDPDLTHPKTLQPPIVIDPDLTHPKTLQPPIVIDSDQTHPKTLKPPIVIDPDLIHPKTLQPPIVIDPDLTHPKTLQPPIVIDPDLTHPKTLKPPIVIDPDLTHPKTLQPPIVIDSDQTHPKTHESPIVIDSDQTHPKTLQPPIVIDSDQTHPKMLQPPIVIDPDLTHPKTLQPPIVIDSDQTHPKTHESPIVIDSDQTHPKTLQPLIVIDSDQTRPKSLKSPIVIDSDQTHPKTLQPPIVIDPDQTHPKTLQPPIVIDRNETHQKSNKSDREHTSRDSEDSGIADSTDEQSTNNVPQHPDETYQKEVIASDYRDIYKAVDVLSGPNSYSVLYIPGNTFIQLVLQSEFKDNTVKSQHMTSRKDLKVDHADTDCDSGLVTAVQREQTDDPEETHPKEVTGDHDSESMSKLKPFEKETVTQHRTNQIWIDDKKSEYATVKYNLNFSLDPPMLSCLEPKTFNDNNTNEVEGLKKDREASNQTDRFMQDLENSNLTSVTTGNQEQIPGSSTGSTDPKTIQQQPSPKQQSDSEDADYLKEIFSSELSQKRKSIIIPDHSSTICDTTTIPRANGYTSSQAHANMAIYPSFKDTRYLPTVLGNIILTDSFELIQHIQWLADLIHSDLDRSPAQRSHEGRIDTEARPDTRTDTPLIGESKPGFDTSLPSRLHNVENITPNMKKGNIEGNHTTHSGYFSEKENDLQHLLKLDSYTRYDDKNRIHYRNIPGMNDISGKVSKDLELSKTEQVSEEIKTDQSSVITTEEPDSQFNHPADPGKERIRGPLHQSESEPDPQPSSPSFEQEATYNQSHNTLAPPHTHGRPRLSDGSDMGLGKHLTPEITDSSQATQQDVQSGQSYSLPAKLQDCFGRRTTEETSECQETASDILPQDSEQDFPQTQDSYQIPSKLQEYGSSEGSVNDSDPDEMTDIPQVPSVRTIAPYNMDSLTYTDCHQQSMFHSTQPDPIQQQTSPSFDVKQIAVISDSPAVSEYLFHISAVDASGHSDASGSRTGGDDASCLTRKVARNTVKIIPNEYMELPQRKGKQQCFIAKTQDNQCQSYSRKSDLIQEFQFASNQEMFGREVRGGHEDESEEDDDADEEENVQLNYDY